MLFKVLAISTPNSVALNIAPGIISHNNRYIDVIYTEILNETSFKVLEYLIQSAKVPPYENIYRHNATILFTGAVLTQLYILSCAAYSFTISINFNGLDSTQSDYLAQSTDFPKYLSKND
jgi:hypothetical protein